MDHGPVKNRQRAPNPLSLLHRRDFNSAHQRLNHVVLHDVAQLRVLGETPVGARAGTTRPLHRGFDAEMGPSVPRDSIKGGFSAVPGG